MELLIAIALMIFGGMFCLRLVLGEKIYERVAAKFIYDIFKSLVTLPFRLIRFLLKALRII